MNSNDQNQIKKFLSSLGLREIPSFNYHHLEHTRIEFKQMNKLITFEDVQIEQFASKSAKWASPQENQLLAGRKAGVLSQQKQIHMCWESNFFLEMHTFCRKSFQRHARETVLTSERQKF